MALKADSFDNGISYLLDAHLFIFPNCAEYGFRVKGKGQMGQRTREDDRLDIVVVTEHPYEELCKVVREDELAKGLASSGDYEWGAVFWDRRKH